MQRTLFRQSLAVLTVAWLIWLLSAPAGIAQVAAARPVAHSDAADRGGSNRFKVRVDVNLTVVPVSVSDASGRPVTGLRLGAFRVYEDGVEQKIVNFSKEEAPVSAVVVFDASGSMKDRMAQSVDAFGLLAKTAVKGDEFSLIRFSDKPIVLVDFSLDPAEVFRKLRLVQAGGWTSLRDAVFLAAHQMRQARNDSKVLLILSDGDDNYSRHSESDVRNRVLESDARVYAIGLFKRPRFLEKLAQETGGDAVIITGLEDLPEAVARMSRAFRNQYLIAYSSSNPQYDGRYRRIKVQVTPPGQQGPFVLHWKSGYYASSE